nr:MAG TPA: hypothetical protein [Bacteriophage sp.]
MVLVPKDLEACDTLSHILIKLLFKSYYATFIPDAFLSLSFLVP